MPILKRAGLRKLVIVVWAMTAVLWTMLEGDMRGAVLLGSFTTLLALALLYERRAARWLVDDAATVFIWGIMGALLGFGSVVITLLWMAVKTGLHAHGPEFSTAEITWLMQQAPLWTTAGLLGGAGVGLVRVAFSRRSG